MVQSISWTDFLLGISSIILGYYTIIFLLLYSGEIVEFFKHRRRFSPASRSDQQTNSNASELMGSVRPDSFREPPSREESVATENLIVVSEEPGEPVDIVSGEVRLAGQQNLLDEVQLLLNTISLDNVSEIASLFHALLERYAHLDDPTYRKHVSVIIHAGCKQLHLPFELHEVESWWPFHSSLETH